MKYGQIKSGGMKTGKDPSGNKDNNKNKNLEQNRDKVGLRGSRSETNSNSNGNLIKRKTVFSNEDSPKKIILLMRTTINMTNLLPLKQK
jgi:hypothetical protein